MECIFAHPSLSIFEWCGPVSVAIKNPSQELKKNLFVLGSYQSLERLKGKIGETPFFKVQQCDTQIFKNIHFMFSVTVRCGASSSENCTYFEGGSSEVGPCSLKICRCDQNVCQVNFQTIILNMINHARKYMFLSFTVET